MSLSHVDSTACFLLLLCLSPLSRRFPDNRAVDLQERGFSEHGAHGRGAVGAQPARGRGGGARVEAVGELQVPPQGLQVQPRGTRA